MKGCILSFVAGAAVASVGIVIMTEPTTPGRIDNVSVVTNNWVFYTKSKEVIEQHMWSDRFRKFKDQKPGVEYFSYKEGKYTGYWYDREWHLPE